MLEMLALAAVFFMVGYVQVKQWFAINEMKTRIMSQHENFKKETSRIHSETKAYQDAVSKYAEKTERYLKELEKKCGVQ